MITESRERQIVRCLRVEDRAIHHIYVLAFVAVVCGGGAAAVLLAN